VRDDVAVIGDTSHQGAARMAHHGTRHERRARLQRPDAWTTIAAAMEFGFSLPGRGPLAGAETILKLATKAESRGLS
jgi:hypothetical protein